MQSLLVFAIACLAAAPASQPVGPDVSFALVHARKGFGLFVQPGGKPMVVVKGGVIDGPWKYGGGIYLTEKGQWVGRVINVDTGDTIDLPEHKELQSKTRPPRSSAIQRRPPTHPDDPPKTRPAAPPFPYKVFDIQELFAEVAGPDGKQFRIPKDYKLDNGWVYTGSYWWKDKKAWVACFFNYDTYDNLNFSTASPFDPPATQPAK